MAKIAPITLYVDGDPVSQPRAKFSTASWSARTPDDSGRVASWKARVSGAFLGLPASDRTRMRSWSDDRGPLDVAIAVRLKKAKSNRKPLPTQVPDVDNLAKAILDALTDVGAWSDDCQIIRMAIVKRWATADQPTGATIRIAPYQEAA